MVPRQLQLLERLGDELGVASNDDDSLAAVPPQALAYRTGDVRFAQPQRRAAAAADAAAPTRIDESTTTQAPTDLTTDVESDASSISTVDDPKCNSAILKQLMINVSYG